MSAPDKVKDKWDRIYRSAGNKTPEPCTVLSDGGFLLPPSGTALDIACGLGGNALYLAKAGLETTAIDISAVAIDKLQYHARQRDLLINTKVASADVDYFKSNGVGAFDVITVANYLDRDLFKILPDLLRDNGLLYYQTFVKDKADQLAGPSNKDFLLEVNELLSLTATLDCRMFFDLGSSGQLAKGLRNQSCIIVQKESKSMASIKTFLAMLDKGPDSALLRYSLGNAYYQDKKYADAAEHLQRATQQDQSYSAAWKLLGRCYVDLGNADAAAETYERGIEIAAANGDKQAEKEMTVFLRRVRKNQDK